MITYLNRILTFAFAAFVAGGLAFGGSQALSTPAYPDCNSGAAIGECPPFDDDSCNDECIDEGFPMGGECGPGGCCRCFI